MKKRARVAGVFGAVGLAAAAAVTVIVRDVEVPTRGTWEWDRIEDVRVTGYRIRWSVVQGQWCESDSIDVLAADACGLAAGCSAEDACCVELEDPPGTLVYFEWVAFSDTQIGESEHGTVVPCP